MFKKNKLYIKNDDDFSDSLLIKVNISKI